MTDAEALAARPHDDAARAAAAVRPWRPPPEPRAVLRAAGVAAPDEIAAAALADLSRSHALTRAELPDGTAYVIKRVSREAHAAGRSLAAELYAYRLASWSPGLAAVMPEAVLLDERRQVALLRAAPSEHLFLARYREPGFPSADLAAALGRALAALHDATADVPLLTVAACGVVRLPDTPEEQRHLGSESAAAAALARAVVADELLAGSLRRTAQALAPACLVHADVKWDNALLDPGPPAHVALLDWELSGRGDPAWDVGSALADTVSMPARLYGLQGLPADCVEWLTPSLRALLSAYDADHAGAQTFAERVTGCWTARMVHLALECASGIGDHRDPVVERLLEVARRLAAGHDRLAPAVGQALGPLA